MKKRLKTLFPISLKDCLIFLAAMGIASVICELLRRITTSDVHVPLIFVLTVLVISFLTNGYFFGTLAAVTSVFAVNWAFTFPYRKLDFTVYGYPLTFITMLAVGIATSTLATGLKVQDKLRLETEREKMRANLLRSVSHDLRTPLTAIGGNISAVLDSSGTLTESENKRLLENAKDDVEWLCTMVENLLSITRISADPSNGITKRDELIEEIFSETVSKFTAHNEGVKVNISCPADPIFIKADAILIEQVLLNLMDNSVKHGMKTRNIYLDARVDGNNAVISVTDDGCGLDEKIIPELFTLSSRLPTDYADGSRFMGIGLAVCSTIVKAHEGTITARNGKNGGAVFEFTIPLGESEIYAG